MPGTQVQVAGIEHVEDYEPETEPETTAETNPDANADVERLQNALQTWKIADSNFKYYQLTDEEFTGLMEFIKKTRKEGNIHLSYACEGFLGKYEGEVRDNFYACGAGVSVASILIDGSISACPSIRSNFCQGNIYHDDFMDVWNNKFEDFRNRDWMRKDQCAACKQFRYCEGNGMHLRDNEGKLMLCHYNKLNY